MNANNTNLSALQVVCERFDSRFQDCVEDFNVGLEKISNFSYRIASEVGANTSNLQSLQLLIERFNTKFENYSADFNKSMNNVSDFAGPVISEVNSVNGNLNSLHGSFESLEYISKQHADHINELVENNADNIKELSSIMFAMKFLMAPPLNETLASAIQKDKLDIWYQTQVDIDKKVIGCEVLLQWEDPIRGVISNSEIFGPEMEVHSDLMVTLDKWVMDNSLKQLAEWLRACAWNQSWVLSINIVQQMATDIAFISYFKALIEKYSLDANNIAIEFKESMVLENVDTMREVFNGLRALGTKIYIDNYGKSHSSLVIYQRLNVDKLKIDRSVINDLINEDGDTSVIRSIMASAKELDLDLIVEGVENDIKKFKLEELGFHHFQGYFVSHPIDGIDYLFNDDE